MLRKGLALLLVFFILNSYAEEVFKPYTLALETTEAISTVKSKLNASLTANNFSLVGAYQPAGDANRWVIIVTHKDLTKAVQQISGLTGFASTLRIALTREQQATLVTYTTPEYWARAYFTEDFDVIESHITKVSSSFEALFATMPGYKKEPFGSKKGLDADDLEDYNYMMGMPKFDDTEELAEYNSHEDALKKIDANLKDGVANVMMVYSYSVPGKKLTLYGFALSGETGEAQFLPKIDLNSPRHTAFLPYEVLVENGKVLMLHGRFRIALSFPDLTMGTFTKIISTPGDIEDLLRSAVN